MSEYPADEFDNPPADAPVGAHRQPVSRWRPVVPFLIILVAVPLLAWGVSQFLIKRDNPLAEQSAGGQQSSSQSAPQSTAPAPTPEPEQSEAPTVIDPVGPGDSESSGGEINLGATVEVVNAAGINGWGAEVTAQLNGEGFTSVEPVTLNVYPSEGNSIRYQSEAEAATAARIGEILGITDIALDPSYSDTHQITVFLVTQ